MDSIVISLNNLSKEEARNRHRWLPAYHSSVSIGGYRRQGVKVAFNSRCTAGTADAALYRKADALASHRDEMARLIHKTGQAYVM
jgi:hypothetical protein